ncbi:hydrogenase [Dethiosulfatarculus sandiegensis]|uniref:Hydrogenase n=1 Tax=Dethiosulfatarculus sandiegensis TaxID=1429043 RepID=A0A0D2JRQ9_9BACT|nr:hydrogenase [Dethiosulfatarculus sandiegensis]
MLSDTVTNVDTIIDRYPGQPEYLIFLLQDIQAEYNYVSPEAMQLVADHTGVPLSRVYAVATFYQSFSLEPKGEHEIRVCMGTACHLKGSGRIVEDLERRLGVEAGHTTEDLSFTLETVNCLGACALAPVMVADEEYHPTVTSQKINKMLKQLTQE